MKYSRAVRFIIVPATVLLVAAPGVAAQVIHGRVLDEATGEPLGVVSVELVDGAGKGRTLTETDSAGVFRLRAPVAGSWLLRLSRIGYADVQTGPVEVGPTERVELELRMSATAVPLEPLRVIGRADHVPGRLREFYDRAALSRRMGRGRVFMRSDLAGMSVPQPSMLLTHAQTRGSCRPTILLDGLQVSSAGELDAVIYMEALEGVELYTGPTQIPQQYANRGWCAVALFWTRVDEEHARPLSWRRVFLAIGIIVSGYVLMQQ
jgi:hypothetical protein